MNSILIVGIIIIVGFVCGEIAKALRLPKVTGYIIAGVLLNPGLFGFIPKSFVAQTDVITNLALCFITFSVGGTLLYSRVKKLGKGIISITLCEAEFAFLVIMLGLLCVTPFLLHIPKAGWFATFIPISILLGSLGSPTDPSATLAVMHEYKAKGDVSSTIMGAAAFDDVLGIINFSVGIVVARAFILHQRFSVGGTLLRPLAVIVGAVLLGIVFGFIFNKVTILIKRETEGAFIVMILGLLALCFGIAKVLKVDELLATMTMGIIVVNYNKFSERIFEMLERYTDELIFVLFFTLSGMYLNFSVLGHAIIIVLFFVVFRAVGKVFGTLTGATIARAPKAVKKYTAGGLIPQGGIVIGLALIIKQKPAFSAFSDMVISIIIGATIIHEIIGPILAKIALKKAGEI